MKNLKLLAVVLSVSAVGAAQADWVKWADVYGTYANGKMMKAQVDFVSPYGDPLLFNDLGQYFLDIDTVDGLTAYDYSGTAVPPVAGAPVAQLGSFSWLLNNYQGGIVMESHIRGTGVSEVGGVVNLASDGLWNWYYSDFGATDMKPWGLTGNYRLFPVGTDETAVGDRTYEFQAETSVPAVPEPFTMGLAALGLGMALKRRRK